MISRNAEKSVISIVMVEKKDIPISVARIKYLPEDGQTKISIVFVKYNENRKLS